MDGKCTACGNALADNEGVLQFDTWFCSTCFIGNAAKLHRELTPTLPLLPPIAEQLAAYR